MANTNRKNTLEQAGEYTLDRCEIVSYKNAENNKPRTIDIKLINKYYKIIFRSAPTYNLMEGNAVVTFDKLKLTLTVRTVTSTGKRKVETKINL